MREIKFRAWGCFGSSRKDKMVEDWQGSDFIEYVGFDGGEAFKVMQYTGLKDEEGVEIYEGDIVTMYVKGTNVLGEIKYHAPAFHLGTIADLWDLNDYQEIEVLGNIYENLELLK